MRRRYSATEFDTPSVDDANDAHDPTSALSELTDADLHALLTAAEAPAPRRRPRLSIPARAPAQYKPKPTPVSWLAIAELVGNAGADPRHCGRPRQESVPHLKTMLLEKLLRDRPEGLVVRAEAADGGLYVDVYVTGAFDEKGGRVLLKWVSEPLIGCPIKHQQTLVMVGWHNKMSRLYRAECATCSATPRDLYWSVGSWCCAACMGLRRKSADDPVFALEKTAKRIRAKLGLERQILSPVVVRSRRHVALARRLLEVEARLVAKTVGPEG